jgi:hypothetical protein
VNGGYDFRRLLADPGIPADYVREDTKGYFRLFRKYYRNADTALAQYGISTGSLIESEPCELQDTDAMEEERYAGSFEM